jgi:integrase-like protein
MCVMLQSHGSNGVQCKGLRFGEFAGLRLRRVHLDRAIPVLQVVDTRYQAGQFGSGFKPAQRATPASARFHWLRSWSRPSAASCRPSPTLTASSSPVPAAAMACPPAHGRPCRATASAASTRPPFIGARADLAHLQLRGPHDLRHSFSTWLEDEGIPARVIDELMGHQRSRRGELDGGSRIGARYRHTTPEMAARVVQALDTRLRLALQVAGATTRAEPNLGNRVY